MAEITEKELKVLENLEEVVCNTLGISSTRSEIHTEYFHLYALLIFPKRKEKKLAKIKDTTYFFYRTKGFKLSKITAGKLGSNKYSNYRFTASKDERSFKIVVQQGAEYSIQIWDKSMK